MERARERESPTMPGREKWAKDSEEDSDFHPGERNGLKTQRKTQISIR